jgi:hypothetical protein
MRPLNKPRNARSDLNRGSHSISEDRKMQNAILEILARAWNPGGFSHGQALRQYESLVPEVARRLLGRASRDELARYLYEKDAVAGEADRFIPCAGKSRKKWQQASLNWHQIREIKIQTLYESTLHFSWRARLPCCVCVGGRYGQPIHNEEGCRTAKERDLSAARQGNRP